MALFSGNIPTDYMEVLSYICELFGFFPPCLQNSFENYFDILLTFKKIGQFRFLAKTKFFLRTNSI